MAKWKKICYGSLPFFATIVLMYTVVFLFLMGSGFVYGILNLEEIKADSQAGTLLFMDEAWLNQIQILANCFVYCVFIIVFGIWYKRVFGKVSREWKTKKNVLTIWAIFISVVFGIGVQCFCSYALNLLLPLFPKVQDNYKLLMEQMGTGQGMIPLIYMGILAPIAEELIFRGLILGYEEKELPFWAANLIQAFLFGVYHQNIVQFVYAFFIGILLGELYKRFRSLKLVMLIHGVINIGGNIIAFLKLDFLVKEQSSMIAAMLISFLVLGVTFFLLCLLGGKNNLTNK